ncbi:MAG: hypothetical protein SGJ16_04165 [Nitrospirota bacterium]|nr:hypothetical protein [Nitrospirota bacterium]
MPDMNAMMAQVMGMGSRRGGFPGMQRHQASIDESLTYLYVTDVQLTNRTMDEPLDQPMAGAGNGRTEIPTDPDSTCGEKKI